MVENTGKTLHAGTGKPVNTPEYVTVEEDDALGLPVAVKDKRRQPIITIDDRWRIDDEWWRTEPVSRLYYRVVLASGQRLVLYKDLLTRGWFRQDY
jgi:hypothetical protein